MVIGRNFLIISGLFLSLFTLQIYAIEQRLSVVTALERGQSSLNAIPLIQTADRKEGSIIPVSITGSAVDGRPEQRSANSSWNTSTALASTKPIVEKLVAEIDGRRLSIRSLDIRLKVKLCNEKGSVHNLNASYIGDMAGNSHLRLTGMFNILAMDVTQVGDRITCWMPLQKAAIAGSRRELITDGQSELALLSAVGGICEVFFPRPWSNDAVQRRVTFDGDRVLVSVFGNTQTTGSCFRRFIVDPGQKTVAAQDIYNSRNSSIGRIEYLEFCPLSTVLKVARPDLDGGLLFPQGVRMANTNGRISLELKVEEVAVNQPVSPEAFKIDLPQNQVVREIGEMLKSGEPLFPK